jgi:RHS repeat-associated protein
MQLQRIKLYYDPRGQVIRTVNPDNSEQRVIYGLPAQVSEPGSYAPTAWETYTYDANDLDPQSPHFGTPKSARVDAMGRTVQTLDRLVISNDPEYNVQMLYEYDIRGNLLNVKDAYNRKVFEHLYDLRPPAKEGEAVPPLKTVHINKGTSHVVFDCTGKPVESRDNKGALILSGYDVLQRPTKLWCRDNASEAVGLRQKLVYGTGSPNLNLVGRLMQKFDESGPMDMRLYDFKGNPLIKIQGVIANSEIQTAIDESDASGWMDMHCYRVDWDTNPTTSGYYRTDMAYDALNRVMKITYPVDANNNRKELIPEYNRAGALKQVYFDGNEYVQNIGYNAKGQRLMIAYGNSLMTRYTYDEQTFRLKRLRTERYTYSSHVTPSGVEELYEYEAGTVKQDFAYRYDKVGNIKNINDDTPGGGIFGLDGLLRSFGYDALYRLLSATGRDVETNTLYPSWNDRYRRSEAFLTTPYTQTYQYDLMGNMNELHKSGANSYTRHYEHSNNLVEEFTAGPHTYYYDYDSCGNQIKENEERNFQWDYGDKLRLYYNQTSLGNEPSVYTHYLYDAGGNRVKKFTRTSGGNWETITYIDGIIEYREDSSKYQSISHVMDASTSSAQSARIATIREGDDFDDSTPAIKYNLDDHLGSSNVLVDENGTLVNREEYYPFGETSFGSYSKKRYRFCGKEKDAESGLYYYGARYYAPWLCRFVSVDPLAGYYPFYTPFQYAGNQPINFIDLDGKEKALPKTQEIKKLPANNKGQTVALDQFLDSFKTFEKYVIPKAGGVTPNLGGNGAIITSPEKKSMADLRIFNHDFTGSDQIVKEIPSFQNTFGSHVDVGGFPLDIKHFFTNIDYSLRIGESATETAGITEEYWQAVNTAGTADAQSSAFSPEDLISNKLGQIFSRSMPSTNNTNLSDNLAPFLKEAKELFETNYVKNGKFFTAEIIAELRAFIGEHYGTVNFMDLQKNKNNPIWQESWRLARVQEVRGSFWQNLAGKTWGLFTDPKTVLGLND